MSTTPRKKVTTACQSCRKRKSRCDGLQPMCRTCITYDSVCVYNREQDSRKTPSKAYISALKARVVTLEDLLDQVLAGDSSEARDAIIRRVREQRNRDRDCTIDQAPVGSHDECQVTGNTPDEDDDNDTDEEECDAVRDMTTLFAHLDVDESGVVYSVGAFSNVIEPKVWRQTPVPQDSFSMEPVFSSPTGQQFDLSLFDFGTLAASVYLTPLEHHLLRLYFTWQHPIAHLFSEDRFMRDLHNGFGNCYSLLLLSVLLSIGAHYSRFANEGQGDMYFARAKALLVDELERPSLTTCQALVLMGAREAGCGRERGSGWLYAGMGFRMQIALGTDRNLKKADRHGYLSAEEIEERAFTFWGSFIHDRGWTAYLGRSHGLPYQDIERDIRMPDRGIHAGTRAWITYTDDNFDAASHSATTPSLPYDVGSFKHLCQLVNLLGSVVRNLYDKSRPQNGKLSQSSDLVTDLHMKLSTWFNLLPPYMRLTNDGTPPPVVLVTHMFYHAALILLFRPFIRSRQSQSSPSSTTTVYNVSPWDICTSSAMSITKCLKEYQRIYSLRRYSNWLVHAVLTSATVYVINTTGFLDTSSNASKASAMCSPAEATRKLEETIAALIEMGAAWTNARKCAEQILRWTSRYGIPVRAFDDLSRHSSHPSTLGATTVNYSFDLPSPQEYMLDMDIYQQQSYNE